MCRRVKMEENVRRRREKVSSDALLFAVPPSTAA